MSDMVERFVLNMEHDNSAKGQDLLAFARQHDADDRELRDALRGLLNADGRCRDEEEGCGLDCPWHRALAAAEALVARLTQKGASDGAC